MINFFHRVLRHILLCPHSPREDDWDNLRYFDFLGEDLLENNQYMLKAGCRDRALSAVKEQINVEKKKGGSGTRSAAAAFNNANHYPFLVACRVFSKKVCDELLRQPAWKSDLVVGLAYLGF